jgi:hypothetical protein
MSIKTRGTRCEGYVGDVGKMGNARKILVGKPEGKIPLGRPRHRFEGNIKI